MFIIPDGAAGALAELERRKFTAEEGVKCSLSISENRLDNLSSQGSSHITEWYTVPWCPPSEPVADSCP